MTDLFLPYYDYYNPYSLRTITSIQGRHLFEYIGVSHGARLWSTDGTDAGTKPLDIRCAGGHCSDPPQWLGNGAGKAFFFGADTANGAWQYFSTDGTQPGTSEIVAPAGREFAAPRNGEEKWAVTLDSALLLAARSGETTELFRTDGTPSGTLPLRQIDPLLAAERVGARVFFLTSSPGGIGVWTSDGTPAGTRLATTIPGAEEPRSLVSAVDWLYFQAKGPEGGEIWRTDGTSGGTIRLSDFADPAAGVLALKTSGNRAAALIHDVTLGEEVWVSDGSRSGSRVATALGYSEALDNDDPGNTFAIAGQHVLVLATDGLQNTLLYSVPFTGAGPSLLRMTCTDDCYGLGWIVAVGGRAVFDSESDAGFEPWTSDGTPGGTSLLADICPGTCSSNAGPIVHDGNRVLLATSEGVWLSGGTALNTYSLYNEAANGPRGAGGPEPSLWSEVDGRLLFPGTDPIHGKELWTTNFAPHSAELLTDLSTSMPPSDLDPIAGTGGRALFFAPLGLNGTRLYFQPEPGGEAALIPGDYYIGYAGPPQFPLFLDFEPDVLYVSTPPYYFYGIDSMGQITELVNTGASQLVGMTSMASEALLVTSDLFESNEIWTSDGTPAGTRHRGSLTPENRLGRGPWAVGSKALGFRFGSEVDALVAFSSDFSTLQTVKNLPSETTLLSAVRPEGEPLGFFTTGRFLETELWRTDGTPGGTVILANPPGYGVRLLDAIRLGSTYYLFVGESSGPVALWRSDGTAAGTAKFAELPGGYGEYGFEATTVGTKLLIRIPQEFGSELWASDGTTAGTLRIADLGPFGYFPASGEILTLGDVALLSGFDLDHGTELWKTDGTAAGTIRLQDLHPGPGSSWPTGLHRSGDSVYFFADDGIHGRELWVMEPSHPSPCVQGPENLCLEIGRFRVETFWRDFEGNSGDAAAVALSADTGYFWFFDEANVELIVKVLDGSGFNGHHWVYYGALSNVEYSITVSDSTTGAARRYFNRPGKFASAGDILAFGPEGAHAVATASGLPARERERFTSAIANPGSCVPTSTRACILGGRFSIEATWRDFQGETGIANASNLTDDTGYLWFFDDSNVEVVLKAVDGSDFNDHFWIYFGALSNVEYEIRVIDTVTGTPRVYRNALGKFASFGDIEAFPAP